MHYGHLHLFNKFWASYEIKIIIDMEVLFCNMKDLLLKVFLDISSFLGLDFLPIRKILQFI